jgi:hypothetical protein
MPSFRASGRTVDAPLLRLLQNLQARHGWAHVTEAGLRKMLAEDTGLRAGEDTVRQALDRIAAQGTLHQVWLVKGGVMPGGEVTYAGVRLVRVAMSRAERTSFAARARGRREMATGRVNHRQLFALMTAQKTLAPPPHPLGELGARRAFEQSRQKQLELAGELAARWALEDERGPPS